MAKKKKKKKRVDLDVRPVGPWFRNYDYGGSEKATKTSPGRGLYNGSMDKYKSITDFLNKKRKPKVAMKQTHVEQILQYASKFEHLIAQTVESDTKLIDTIRQKYGQSIFNDAQKFLNENAVSSIPIRIVFENNKVIFQVQSTGADSTKVDGELSNLLNQKYAVVIFGLINKMTGGKAAPFNFGLTTVESA